MSAHYAFLLALPLTPALGAEGLPCERHVVEPVAGRAWAETGACPA